MGNIDNIDLLLIALIIKGMKKQDIEIRMSYQDR
jgi:hypothetical protein